MSRSGVPRAALWMSPTVSPSPSPLSGSLLVTDASTKAAPGQLSVTVTVPWTSRKGWFGGPRRAGFALAEIEGGVLSTTWTCVLLDEVAAHPSAPVSLMVSSAGEALTFETSTLPLTDTVFPSVCWALNCTGPRSKLFPPLIAWTLTAPALTPQSSTTEPLNVTTSLQVSSTAPPTAPTATVGGVCITEKLLSETSKNTLPTAEALTRALFVAPQGTTASAAPSLAVAATRGVNELPPLSEKRSSTKLATLPPPTLQVTGSGQPAPNDSPPFGLVT